MTPKNILMCGALTMAVGLILVLTTAPAWSGLVLIGAGGLLATSAATRYAYERRAAVGEGSLDRPDKFSSRRIIEVLIATGVGLALAFTSVGNQFIFAFGVAAGLCIAVVEVVASRRRQ